MIQKSTKHFLAHTHMDTFSYICMYLQFEIPRSYFKKEYSPTDIIYVCVCGSESVYRTYYCLITRANLSYIALPLKLSYALFASFQNPSRVNGSVSSE